MFNQVKQAYDYDPKGNYIKHWVEELRGVENVEGVFQCWKLSMSEREKAVAVNEDAKAAVGRPLVRVEYGSGRRGRDGGRGGRE